MTTGTRPLAVTYGRQLPSLLEIIVAILRQPVIEQILSDLGPWARALR